MPGRSSLLFLIALPLALLLALPGNHGKALAHHGGPHVPCEIGADLTLTAAGGPYDLDCRVVIPDGVTLTIEPGTTVRGDVDGRFIVRGHLQAVGTRAAPILLTSTQETGPAEWEGIHFEGGTGTLRHLTIRFAGDQLPGTLELTGGASVTVRDALIHFGASDGINARGSALEVTCSTIADHADDGIWVQDVGSQVTVQGSALVGNGRGLAASVSLPEPVDARYNWWGAPSGPGDGTPGSGAEVFGPVLDEPWLPADTCITDLVAEPVDWEGPVLPGEPFTVTLAVSNLGPADPTGATLHLMLPDDVTFQAATAEQGSCSHTGGEITCTLGELAQGQRVGVTVTAELDEGATGRHIHIERAVTGGDYELDPTDNSGTTEIPAGHHVYLPAVTH